MTRRAWHSLLAAGHLSIAMSAAELSADETANRFLGAWGSAAQCQAWQAGEVDDQRLQPYVIGDQWLQHGIVWCRVHWLGRSGAGDQQAATTHLQCGEDTVRDYRVQLQLADDTLVMNWSRDFTTAPLQRCHKDG